jgi:glycerophosphoryl diester phosphodiesterase
VTAGALHSARTLERAGSTLAAAMEEARRAGVGFIGLHQGLVDADAVAAAKRAGLALGVWTVNERDPMARVIRDGAGIVITDRPDLARELLGR